MMPSQDDFMTEPLAERLRGRVERYWKKRGYEVESWTEQTGHRDHGGSIWAVRSDLVNGYPRGWSGAVKNAYEAEK